MTIEQEIHSRIKENEERLSKLRRAESRIVVPSLAAFENLSGTEKAQLYEVDPERFIAFYKVIADRGMERLLGGSNV